MDIIMPSSNNTLPGGTKPFSTSDLVDSQPQSQSLIFGFLEQQDEGCVTSAPITCTTEDLQNEDFSQFLFSIETLLSKYKMYSKSSNDAVVSGGLQQFITRKIRERSDQGTSTLQSISSRLRALYVKDNDVVSIHNNGSEEQGVSFIQCLPVDLKLHIFSFLDAKSLCNACCVDREWNHLTCDQFLWKDLLQKDIQAWNQISYLTNPKMYEAIDSEWTNKEIYLKCSPAYQKMFRESNSTFNQVSSVLKSLLPKKVPKVAMFGPGLEQSTSGLVRHMLYTDNDIFKRTAMFPGQDGVGGGITLKLNSGHSLHLSVLYTASRAERENRVGGDRMQGNRMIQRQAGQNAEEALTLNPQIRQFSQTVDAYVFVVDASETSQSIAHESKELHLMLRERLSSPHVPVLILSCVKDSSVNRLPSCEIVDLLNLTDVPHPWLIINCESESLKSVDAGIVWLVDQAQYK